MVNIKHMPSISSVSRFPGIRYEPVSVGSRSQSRGKRNFDYPARELVQGAVSELSGERLGVNRILPSPRTVSAYRRSDSVDRRELDSDSIKGFQVRGKYR